MNLAPAARQLNARQRFAAVVTLGMRTEAPTPTEQQQLQRMFQRHTASGKRILVVPILVAAGASEPSVQPWLEGLPYETAKAGLMPDDRLVEWVLSSAGKEIVAPTPVTIHFRRVDRAWRLVGLLRLPEQNDSDKRCAFGVRAGSTYRVSVGPTPDK